MPRRQMTCGGNPVMSRPRKPTAPWSGTTKPVSAAKSVVLPAPLGPIRPAIEPSATSRLAPSTARRPPKIFDSARTSSMPPPPSKHVDQPVRQKADDEDQQRAVDDERKALRV